jgi:CheY-like chemotaxis protein
MKSILVVDDDQPLRTALKEAVTRMGYEVQA